VSQEFESCGYERMLTTHDCPHSETKEQFIDASETKLVNTIRSHIKGKVGIFQSDIVSVESLRLYFEMLGFDQKVEHSIHKLIAAGLLDKLISKNSKFFIRIDINVWSYDEDLMQYDLRGTKFKALAYAVRNTEYWGDTSIKDKPFKVEHDKLIGVRGGLLKT
jgi:hypothetical protein